MKLKMTDKDGWQEIFRQLFSSTWWSLHYWKYGSALLSWAIEQLNKRAEFNADGMAKRNSLRMRNTSCQRVWSSNSSWKNGQYSLTWVKMGALNTSAMIWIIEAFKTTTTCRLHAYNWSFWIETTMVMIWFIYIIMSSKSGTYLY